jgi:glycosyltransferase involved in cell wall biosynthesis
MLSVVICSRESKISSFLTDNIEKTIGCSYELIVINNSDAKYSIFEAYNIGIKKSTSDFLCFLHDDILIHTEDWGIKLKNIFEKNKNVGLVGVAGSKIKTKMPSAWWDCPQEMRVINIIQHFSNKSKEHWNIGFTNKLLEEVVVIDGVFMAWRKDDRIKFNEKQIGFHNYDLNISFENIKYGYKIIVTDEILIEHFSKGNLNKSWLESTIKLHQIYKNILPLYTNDSQNSISFQNIEFNNGTRFIKQLINLGLRIKAVKIWVQLIAIKPISKYHLKFIKTIFK